MVQELTATPPGPGALTARDGSTKDLAVMKEYNEALVRKLEERNAELEQARAEVSRANTELERRVQERTSELMAAIQELEAFSHSLAHDLRSPLMAIDGFIQVLIEESQDKLGEKSIKHLKYIGKATKRMSDLTDDLLRLARASRGEMRRESVDLSAMAEMGSSPRFAASASGADCRGRHRALLGRFRGSRPPAHRRGKSLEQCLEIQQQNRTRPDRAGRPKDRRRTRVFHRRDNLASPAST